MTELERLQKENKELQETVLELINQACQVEFDQPTGKCIVDDMALMTYRYALDLLERLRLAKKVVGTSRRWELIWPKEEVRDGTRS